MLQNMAVPMGTLGPDIGAFLSLALVAAALVCVLLRRLRTLGCGLWTGLLCNGAIVLILATALGSRS